MLELINQTHWQAALFPGYDQQHQPQQTLVVKASFNYDLQQQVVAKTQQTPINLIDEYQIAGSNASLHACHEIMPYKQGWELIVYANAEPSQPCQVMETSIKLWRSQQLLWQKSLRIFGKRYWQKSILGCIASKPDNITCLPISYEFAYGGADHQANPIGQGAFSTKKNINGNALPQIELTNQLISKPQHQPTPGGFGPISPAWLPTISKQGSVKDERLSTRPIDAKADCYNQAPADQQFTDQLFGDELITLKGVTKGLNQTEELYLPLPTIKLNAKLSTMDSLCDIPLTLDTMVIDCRKQEINLISRGQISWPEINTQIGMIVLQSTLS